MFWQVFKIITITLTTFKILINQKLDKFVLISENQSVVKSSTIKKIIIIYVFFKFYLPVKCLIKCLIFFSFVVICFMTKNNLFLYIEIYVFWNVLNLTKHNSSWILTVHKKIHLGKEKSKLTSFFFFRQ